MNGLANHWLLKGPTHLCAFFFVKCSEPCKSLCNFMLFINCLVNLKAFSAGSHSDRTILPSSQQFLTKYSWGSFALNSRQNLEAQRIHQIVVIYSLQLCAVCWAHVPAHRHSHDNTTIFTVYYLQIIKRNRSHLVPTLLSHLWFLTGHSVRLQSCPITCSCFIILAVESFSEHQI